MEETNFETGSIAVIRDRTGKKLKRYPFEGTPDKREVGGSSPLKPIAYADGAYAQDRKSVV